MKATEYPEACYYFFAMLATEPKQRFYAGRGVGRRRPGGSLPDPRSRTAPAISRTTSRRAGPRDANEYCKAYYQNFNNPNQLPYLRIPGAELLGQLDIRLSEFWTGQVATAEEALANVATDWDEVTDGLDRDLQKASYRTSLGLD